MNEIPNIITERVDDIPLLIEQMQRMGLPTLLDNHFPTHGNWTGLSLGWVSTIWLSSMLSRGDHRMVHVEPWVAKRLWTLGFTTGQAVMRVDFTDDRLEIVLRRLSEDTRWAAFESALNQHTVRVYDLATARVHVDIDLQKMNWKCRTGVNEQMGVSLQKLCIHTSIGGYTHADQDTGQYCHCSSLA